MAVIVGGAAGCSLVFDNQKTQCDSDADCESFGGHPFCTQGVCVASGLGPEGCIVTTKPKTQEEFLNACSTSKYVDFNNCNHLNLCPDTELKAVPEAHGQMTKKQDAPVVKVDPPTAGCSANLPTGGVIYLYGSADFGPLLRAAQPTLYTKNQVRAVFQGSTSCNGVKAAFDPTATQTLMKNPTNGTGFAFYFDEQGRQVNCLLDVDDPATPDRNEAPSIDVGVSNLFAQTCDATLAVRPPNVAEYAGLVVTFVLSVPGTSRAESISVEAAHLVFGLGGTPPAESGMSKADPWLDWNTYYIRNSGAGSTVLTSLLIEVPRDQFWGTDTLSTENLRDSLLAAPASAADSAIGILSADFNDSPSSRGNLKALYLRARGQRTGYLPDSSPVVKDKINVRDGHYPLWGYVHLFVPATSAVHALPISVLFNASQLEQRFLDEIIAASLTPQCAMKVARSTEMGDFATRTGFQCGCYFDLKAKGRTDCKTCNNSDECPGAAPNCNYGYCEAN